MQIILQKEKYSLSCLIQWEIYTVEAGTESREDRIFDGLKINQTSSLTTRIDTHLIKINICRRKETHCDLGYVEIKRGILMMVNFRTVPPSGLPIPCSMLKPPAGTPLVPVTNCNKRAFIS